MEVSDSLEPALYFNGQWVSGPDQGLEQAGMLDIYESGWDGHANGSATLSMGPAPEPSTLMLLGSGVLGLVGVLRKRQFLG